MSIQSSQGERSQPRSLRISGSGARTVERQNSYKARQVVKDEVLGQTDRPQARPVPVRNGRDSFKVDVGNTKNKSRSKSRKLNLNRRRKTVLNAEVQAADGNMKMLKSTERIVEDRLNYESNKIEKGDKETINEEEGTKRVVSTPSQLPPDISSKVLTKPRKVHHMDFETIFEINKIKEAHTENIQRPTTEFVANISPKVTLKPKKAKHINEFKDQTFFSLFADFQRTEENAETFGEPYFSYFITL